MPLVIRRLSLVVNTFQESASPSFFTSMQKVAFYRLKANLLQRKRLPFILLKAMYWFCLKFVCFYTMFDLASRYIGVTLYCWFAKLCCTLVLNLKLLFANS